MADKAPVKKDEHHLYERVNDIFDKIFNLKVGTYSKIDHCRNNLNERIDTLYKLIKIAVGASIFGAVIGIINWIF